MAYLVFLLVKRFLFLLGNMTMALRSHITFFLSYLTVFPVQLPRLFMVHFTLAHFVMNPTILISQTTIYLIAARMTLGIRTEGESNEEDGRDHRKQGIFHGC